VCPAAAERAVAGSGGTPVRWGSVSSISGLRFSPRITTAKRYSLTWRTSVDTPGQLQVPRRAKYIRMLLSELFRITNHLNFLAELVEILGHDIVWNMIMLEREKLLGIIELIIGARVIPNYVRIGGVNSRIGSDIIKKIRRETAAFLKKFRKIERIIIADFAIIERLRGLGVISKDTVRGAGISGPNMRASAIRYDLRKNLDYTGYRNIHFTIPYAKNGDCLDRMMVRFGEVYQSIKIIEQIVEQIPSGPVMKRINLSHLDFSRTPFTASVECPHGIFKIFGEAEGNSLRIFTVMSPSRQSLSLIGTLLEGNSFNDIEVIIASLDISGGEIMSLI
jgi:NADH-quinone oxidoreductase subunit D